MTKTIAKSVARTKGHAVSSYDEFMAVYLPNRKRELEEEAEEELDPYKRGELLAQRLIEKYTKSASKKK